MKKLLLSAALIASGSVSFAQVIEDFESITVPNLPAGWTQVTAATDGGYATTTDITSQYFVVPSHTNYAGTNDDVCNCDKANEKLISPAVAIPGSGADLITFAYALGAYYGETAEFGVSTDGGATVTSLGVLATTRVGATSDHDWATASYALAAYAGTTVNFVWTYMDNAGWGSGLTVDDVEMIAIAAVDMEMTALTMAPTVTAGMVDITGTITSLGSANVTSVDIAWDANSASFPVNMNYGDTYNFTHTVQLNAVAGTTYNPVVCVNLAGDADNGNDCLTGSVSAVSSIVAKVTVGEEKTGEWCGWCPRGAVALANMELSNPSDFIGVAVHNGDPMSVASYDGSIGTYVPGGYPGGGVDRVETGDPSDFAAMHATRVAMVPPASIVASATISGNTITVTVEANFVGGLTGDYRLAAILLEDNVTGTSQSNYYDDGGAGALVYPNTGSMPNFDWVGAGGSVSPVWHDHVARALGADEINGSAGSLPATITAGSTETYTYTITKDAAWKLSDIHVVGMLVNGATGEILNAGKGGFPAGLTTPDASNFDLSVMPNPTNGVTAVVLNLEEAAEVSMVIVDIVGNVVFNSGSDNLAAGSYPTSIDLSGQADGIYFAKVSVNGALKTVKINLTK